MLRRSPRSKIYKPTTPIDAAAGFPIKGAVADGRPRVLVFFSPWCESYLEKSRPADAAACRRVREEVNRLASHGRCALAWRCLGDLVIGQGPERVSGDQSPFNSALPRRKRPDVPIIQGPASAHSHHSRQDGPGRKAPGPARSASMPRSVRQGQLRDAEGRSFLDAIAVASGCTADLASSGAACSARQCHPARTDRRRTRNSRRRGRAGDPDAHQARLAWLLGQSGRRRPADEDRVAVAARRWPGAAALPGAGPAAGRRDRQLCL